MLRFNLKLNISTFVASNRRERKLIIHSVFLCAPPALSVCGAFKCVSLCSDIGVSYSAAVESMVRFKKTSLQFSSDLIMRELKLQFVQKLESEIMNIISDAHSASINVIWSKLKVHAEIMNQVVLQDLY